jgi:EmrB/QacA subfamily drug resistance transporter
VSRKWWTLLVVCAASFMLLLDVSIVVVALPKIQSGLRSSYADLQWMVDAYALTLASFMLTAGSLADRYGRRLLFLVGLTVFTLGSLMCGLAQSPLMLIGSRSFQGVGGAIMYATALALLAQSFRGSERGVAFAIWGTVTGVAIALGPILGGVITSWISWRAIFLVNVPIGVAAVALTVARVEESRTPQPHRPDWRGFASLTTALVSLVFGLIRAGEAGWRDGWVLASFCLAAVATAAFVAVELRARHPMFDLSLFRVPTFSGGLIAGFTMNGSLFAMLLFLVLYLQEDRGYSALQTGTRMLLISGGMLIPRVIAGRLSSRVPLRWFLGPGLALVGFGLLLMSGLQARSSWTHLAAGFLVAGVGSGLVNPPLASTAVGVVEPERAGMAAGVNSTFRQIGIATSIAALGTIFASALAAHARSALAPTTTLAARSARIALAIRRGQARHVIAATAEHLRRTLAGAIHAAFASALNEILVVAAIVAFVGAFASLFLVRSRDFVGMDRDVAEARRGRDASAAKTLERAERR